MSEGMSEGNLGGGFKYVLFSPLFGEDSQFDEHIFQRGWNHQLAMFEKMSELLPDVRKKMMSDVMSD